MEILLQTRLGRCRIKIFLLFVMICIIPKSMKNKIIRSNTFLFGATPVGINSAAGPCFRYFGAHSYYFYFIDRGSQYA